MSGPPLLLLGVPGMGTDRCDAVEWAYAGAGSGHLGRSGAASCGGGTEPALKAEEEWGWEQLGGGGSLCACTKVAQAYDYLQNSQSFGRARSPLGYRCRP